MASSEETNMEEEVHANQSPKTLLSSHHHDHNHHAHFLVQDPVEGRPGISFEHWYSFFFFLNKARLKKS